MQQINYQPLTSLKMSHIEPKHLFTGVTVLIAVTLFGDVLFGQIFAGFSTLMTVGIFLFVISYFFIQSSRVNKKNAATITAFAQHNNFSYKAIDITSSRPGTLFDEGHSKKATDIVSGVIGDYPFSNFSYVYTTGSGKNATTHDAMVFEVTLPRIMPQFVIDSQLEHVVPIVFDRSQKIELEGDFHKYFDLYAPDNYGVTALTILAPDAMEILMQHAALCDIEVIENKLYFYWPVPARSEAQYRQIFETAAAVLEKIGDALSHRDIFASKSQAHIHTTAVDGGVKLKRAKFGWIAGGFIAAYVAIQFIGMTSLSEYAGMAILLFWASMFIIFVVAVQRCSRLKKEYLARYRKEYIA